MLIIHSYKLFVWTSADRFVLHWICSCQFGLDMLCDINRYISRLSPVPWNKYPNSFLHHCQCVIYNFRQCHSFVSGVTSSVLHLHWLVTWVLFHRSFSGLCISPSLKSLCLVKLCTFPVFSLLLPCYCPAVYSMLLLACSAFLLAWPIA